MLKRRTIMKSFKKTFGKVLILLIAALCMSICVFAQETLLAGTSGNDLGNNFYASNNYKDTDENLCNCTITKSLVTGIGGKTADDTSLNCRLDPQPVNDESYGSRQNYKQYFNLSTSVYGITDCENKYVVFEANFLPMTVDSIGTLTLQPNAGLNTSVTVTADDGVINVGKWNHIRIVAVPSTPVDDQTVYPYTYFYVNGKLVKEGSAKRNHAAYYLPYRLMSDCGSTPDKVQNVYWDDFKAYITDTKPGEYSMPALYTDGSSLEASNGTLFVYDETTAGSLKGTANEKIVVYDTESYDYILPDSAKLYDGNLVCVNGSDGKVAYYKVKKQLKNYASVTIKNNGFVVSANLDSAVLVAAGYDINGVLQELYHTSQKGVNTLNISSNCHSAHGFVFDSLSSLSPKTPVATASKNPTISIWGASITQGQGGTVSYPATVEALSGYTVYNMGIGGETQTTVAARQGALDIKLTKDVVIPKSGSVNIEFAAYNKDDGQYAGVVTPRNASGAGWNPVSIGGVEGTLTFEILTKDENGNDVWPRVLKSATFTRKQQGEEVNAPAGTLMTVEGQTVKSDITIFTVSSNGGWTSENTTAKDSQYEGLINLLDRQIAYSKYPEKTLVVGLTTQTNKQWTQVHAALRAKYGEKFFDVRSLLASSEALERAGITPTQTDLELIAVGQIPASLISNYPADAVHMNTAGYTLMGTYVYEKLVELGYVENKES